MSKLRLAFAGDRDIAVWVLDFLLSQNVSPLALLLPDESKASHAQDLRRRCSYLSEENILVGARFREPSGIELLRGLQLDYIVGIHFPYIIPEAVLDISGRGFLNLHPAYLPFNRGWHTPTWAILEGTPAGATLHFMDRGLDTGDIVHQKQLQVSDDDTADTLYRKLKQLELEVFQQAWPQLLSGQPTRIPQDPNTGTFHKRKDLFQPEVQKINLDEPATARELITRWRALTTNRIDEAAYFEVDGERHRLRIVITPDERHEPTNGGPKGLIKPPEDAQVPSSAHLSFPSWPYFEADEIEAAASILRSGKVNYWTGDAGRRFEDEFAAYVGCRHAVALANGTVALELALHALGVGAEDEVITTSRTFIASASCAVMRGARPVLADVDRDSQNITAETIRAVLSPRTKAIIAVHLAGWPCDMDPILQLAGEHGLKVIEDCAQALGATYKGRPVGSMGDAAAFSFCQDKIMTTGGEGGMMTTNNEAVWKRAWSFKDHGKSYDAVYCRAHPPGFRWLHESFGTNWRMTEMQSAIGRVALRKVAAWVEMRRRNAAILTDSFANIPALRVAVPPADVRNSYYKYYAFVRPERLREGWNRDRILQAVTACDIPCFSGSCSEIYLEKAFPAAWRPEDRLAVARELGETSLMFLVHPKLDEKHMRATCNAVDKIMKAASVPTSVFAVA